MSPERGTTPDSSTAPSEERTPPARPIALCLHEPPGAPPHFDLFLAPEGRFGAEERVLESWRLPGDLRTLKPGEQMTIEPLGRHRGLYAGLEAPRELTHGRGRVSPIAAGRARATVIDGATRALGIEWSDGARGFFELNPSSEGTCELVRRAR